VAAQRLLIERDPPQISIRRQCELIGLNRSSLYYEPAGESEYNLLLMRLIDEQYTRTPFYGGPRMTAYLRRLGHRVNHKRVRRLMRLMGLQAVGPKPRITTTAPGHRVYPYLLRGLAIERPLQVWCADITYVPMQHGFMYLVAVLDWFSRYVLAWQLSNTLDGRFCQEALRQALHSGTPEIFNTDQGVQFTAQAFTAILHEADIRISMDGRGRAMDNIMIERLWRTVKYENIYLMDYATVPELETGLQHYFHFYNYERLHQSLAYCTPAEVHFAQTNAGSCGYVDNSPLRSELPTDVLHPPYPQHDDWRLCLPVAQECLSP
jgi:putative transposase